MQGIKITFKYILACLAAVIFTWFIPEFAHWFSSSLLGYEAMMYLNKVSPVDGQNHLAWHETLISAAGPIITIVQGALVFFFLKGNWNKFLYPLLFTAFYMRFLAGVVNFNNPNDEGRISIYFELGLFTLPILVSALLFFMVYKISKKHQLNWKFQTATTFAVIVFSSILIIADQFLQIRIL